MLTAAVRMFLLIIFSKTGLSFRFFYGKHTTLTLKSAIDPLEETKMTKSTAQIQKAITPLNRETKIKLQKQYDRNITDRNIYDINTGNKSSLVYVNSSTLHIIIYSEFKSVCQQIIPR